VLIILRAIGALPTTVSSRMTKVDSRPIVSLGITTRAHTMAGSLPSIFFLVVQELVTTTASMVRVVSAMSSTVLIILRAIGALPTTVSSRMTKVDSRPIVSLGVTTTAHTMVVQECAQSKPSCISRPNRQILPAQESLLPDGRGYHRLTQNR